jgi:putative inorganic carbon (HCO3(-)) transporter
MGPALAVAQPASKLGVVLAAIAAAGVLIDRDERRRAAFMVAALVLAAVILVGHISDTDQFHSISDDARKLAALCLLGIASVAGLATVFRRYPQALPLAAIAVLPFRIPVAVGGSTANLLVPLYVVIAGGCAAYVWRAWSDGKPDPPPTSSRREPARLLADGRPMFLGLALGAFVFLYALQSLYSRDFDQALEQVIFFYVPFALLFRLLVDTEWSSRLVLGCAAIAVGLAVVFAGIGFWEYDRRELLWNPKVIAANQLQSYFRVNSVFWDPNIYGRFLMLVMIAITAFVLWERRGPIVLGAAALLVILWGGLVLTFSQSSFGALLAGLAMLSALRWDARRTAAAGILGLVAATVFVLAFQSTLKIHLGSSSGVNTVTSGRGDLISGGLDLIAKRPLWGYGSGSFGRAYRQERKGNQEEAVSASHTMPITIAAEQGLIGLAAYAALLLVSLMTLFGNDPSRAPPALDGRARNAFLPARAALAAMFCALVVHTLGYAAFLEDPFTWVILAAGVALAPCATLAKARVRAPATSTERVPAPAA